MKFRKGFNYFYFGGELVCMFVICCYCIYIYIYIYIVHIVYLSLFPHMHVLMCSFKCFRRQVHFDQDLLPLFATFWLEVLDWNL